MRNTAKKGCTTDYTFVIDIDMVPNPGLELELRQFLKEVEKCEDEKIGKTG